MRHITPAPYSLYCISALSNTHAETHAHTNTHTSTRTHQHAHYHAHYHSCHPLATARTHHAHIASIAVAIITIIIISGPALAP